MELASAAATRRDLETELRDSVTVQSHRDSLASLESQLAQFRDSQGGGGRQSEASAGVSVVFDQDDVAMTSLPTTELQTMKDELNELHLKLDTVRTATSHWREGVGGSVLGGVGGGPLKRVRAKVRGRVRWLLLYTTEFDG